MFNWKLHAFSVPNNDSLVMDEYIKWKFSDC